VALKKPDRALVSGQTTGPVFKTMVSLLSHITELYFVTNMIISVNIILHTYLFRISKNDQQHKAMFCLDCQKFRSKNRGVQNKTGSKVDSQDTRMYVLHYEADVDMF
jgi:hypothetical protein